MSPIYKLLMTQVATKEDLFKPRLVLKKRDM